MNRQIFNIALPSIISNVTVPLLALADTTIVGHLGAASYIGAIAVGGMIFNMIYWLFGFLRMGTGGLTAQAFGAADTVESLRVLIRSLMLAALVGLLMLGLQVPLADGVFRLMDATPEVERLARCYFFTLVWGAPAVLGLYSFSGWFLGMQNARIPMVIAIVQNVVNVGASLFFVFGLGMKVRGVALGTLVAQYLGLLMAVAFWMERYHPFRTTAWRFGLFVRQAWGRFFSVNRDIFLRTLCLISVTTCFTSRGAAQGDLVLAANALLMQFYIFFSYVMDGFAYAGEAMGGRFCGAHDERRFRLLTRHLFVCGCFSTVVFTLVYAFGSHTILQWLTDDVAVVDEAVHYIPYVACIPLASVAAFLFDGLYVGTTSTRYMLLSMMVAVGVFFLVLGLGHDGNVTLWWAFLLYLGCRGLVQAAFFPKVLRKIRA